MLGWFRRYVVGLLIGGYVGSDFQWSVYTGFLIMYKEYYLWITAGHVIDEIGAALASPNFKIDIMRWLDSYDAAGPQGAPVHHRNLTMSSWKDSGIDFGTVILAQLDAESLFANDKIRVMNLTNWRPANSVPEGYYAIGFPREWSTLTSRKQPENKILRNLRADLACLPVQIVQWLADGEPADFWNDPEAFYGEILTYPDRPSVEIDDIKGMSGGPVFSLQRIDDGNIMYRLAGIQRTWIPPRRIIRAEPTSKVLELLDAWL